MPPEIQLGKTALRTIAVRLAKMRAMEKIILELLNKRFPGFEEEARAALRAEWKANKQAHIYLASSLLERSEDDAYIDVQAQEISPKRNPPQ
jgi:hypothetical protein